jgi:hypothetical protein
VTLTLTLTPFLTLTPPLSLQTGAGKTHTMEGRADPPFLRGIIPNSFQVRVGIGVRVGIRVGVTVTVRDRVRVNSMLWKVEQTPPS